VDVLSTNQRSRNMAAIKGRNTKPEILVRQMLHAHGFRFRLHRRDLPGRPDIVLPKYKTVVFVNGCFWHQHVGCKFATKPSSRVEFWDAKLTRNVARDFENAAKLAELGWRVIVVWECELRDANAVITRLLSGLKPSV
jgi:DNA mismatch endonuclease (patch repair protein)